MTDKDPKDMTVSEQLRWAANGEPYNGIDENIWTYPTGKIRALAEAVTGEWPSDNEIFSIVADKIDAELAQVRAADLRDLAAIWAVTNGWPDFREGEVFGAWLDRCAYKKPVDDCGEPVQFGDDTDKLNGVEKFIFLRSGGGCCQMQDAEGNIHNVYPGERVKRPAPEVLGADGLPIKVGDAMWSLSGAGPLTVTSLHTDDPTPDGGDSPWGDLDDDGLYSWIYAGSLTHTPPDTLERLRDDITEWRADCANPGSGWDVKTAEWASRIDAIIRRRGSAE